VVNTVVIGLLSGNQLSQELSPLSPYGDGLVRAAA
jgi:hypothetical protein